MTERLFTLAIWLSAVLVAAVLVWVIGDLVRLGIPHLSLDFLISAPRDAGRTGGIGPILVSTVLIIGVTLAVALPLGLMAAVWLAEFTARGNVLGSAIRLSLDVMAGVPSIVFGLFGNAFFSICAATPNDLLSTHTRS